MQLPTLTSASWSVTALYDSVREKLRSETDCDRLQLYFYAITEPGWRAVRKNLLNWKASRKNRAISVYVGTDHGITDAEALTAMSADGVDVNVMNNYIGIYHPKVIWLTSANKNTIWIGSNNLTRDGLLNNIEFAACLEFEEVPASLRKWADEVHASSTKCSKELIDSYDKERNSYGEKRVALGNFTWSQRETPSPPTRRGRSPAPRARKQTRTTSIGDLLLEIMPRETGAGGKQIQLPMRAADDFFNVRGPSGSGHTITLTPSWLRDPRELTITIFKNRTARLVIRELDYRDRPCLIHFKKITETQFTFDIVSRAVMPVEYRALINQCNAPTRTGSRRWAIISS